MVTKKTRLLSGLVAVLMLISLFAAFVLPVSAAEGATGSSDIEIQNTEGAITYDDTFTDVENYSAPRAKDYETYAYEDYKNWIVADADDWRGIVEMGKTNNFSDKTIHLVKNIDMNHEHVDPVKTAFAGKLDGHDFEFQNFKMEINIIKSSATPTGAVGEIQVPSTNQVNIGLFAEGAAGSVIANVGIANGSINVGGDAGGGSKNVFVGAFVGGTCSTSFYKCWNGADIIINLSSGTVSASGIARTSGATLVNCYNIGEVNAKSASTYGVRATGLADWAGYTTFYNGFSAGPLVGANGTAAAVFTTNANGVAGNKAANLYAFGHQVILNDANGLASALPTVTDDAYTTGELAWSLNKHYEPITGYPQVYYTLENGKTVFGDSTNQTRRVALQFPGLDSLYYYGKTGDVVELDYNDSETSYEIVSGTGAALVGNRLTIGTSDVEVTLKISGLFYGDLDKAISHWDGLNPLYFVNGEELKTALEEAKDKRANKTFEDQAEVVEYTDLLNSFVGKYAAYPNLPLASEVDIYSDTANFLINSIDEMNYVAEFQTKFTADKALHFAIEGNEITVPDGALANDWNGVNAAIDGHGVTIIGVDYVGSRDASTLGDAWLGNYAGAYLKNITFRDWTATTLGYQGALIVSSVGASTEFANLHFIDCTATKLNGNGMGILAGIQQGNYQATFTDITFEGCTLDMNGRGASNSAFLIGRVSAGSITADNIYLNNNKYTSRGSSNYGGRGVVIGECTATATFTDIGVFNTTYEGVVVIDGLISGTVKKGATVTYTNIFTGNNGTYPMVWHQGGSSEAPANLTFNHVYTDAPYMVNGNKAVAVNQVIVGNITTEQAMNGYAAVQLNAVTGSAKWEILPNATAPSFDTDGLGLPCTITFSAVDYFDETEDVVAYRYTNTAGTVMGLDDELMRSAVWPSKEELLAMVFTTNSTVSGTPLPAHECIWGNLVPVENTASHTAECIWESNGIACPKTTTLDCEFANLTPVDPNAEPANATHSGTCACGAVGSALPCELTTFTVAPTCEDSGSVTYVCDCGYIHTDLTDSLGHDWSAWTGNEVEEGAEHTHSRECANGGEIQTEACTYNGEWIEEKAPSVIEPGLQKKTCDEACGSYITQEIPALAHFEIEAETGILGKEMNVKVNLKNSLGVAGTKLTVTYDPTAVTFVGADKGDWTENTLVFGGPVSEVDANGNVTVIVNFVSPANLVGDGTLVNLTFAVAEDAALGQYDIAVSAEGKDAVDKNAVPVPVAAATGKLEIVDHVNGDISGDGAVSIIDAVLMLRYACGDDMTGVELDLDAADITGEGDVMMDDVVLVLRYLNGTIANL